MLQSKPSCIARLACLALVASVLSLVVVQPASAGNNQLFGQRSVGGVAIDIDGVIRQATEVEKLDILNRIRQDADKVEPGMKPATELRKVSLRKLQEQIRDALENHQGEIPDSVDYLGGLQRIQYIFVYPEQNDIVLAGPGEGWKVDERNGDVVGVTTGRPVLRLDYLLTALRTVEAARTEGISVSIDPTPQGRQAFDAVLRRQTRFTQAAVAQLANAMGPQDITFTGISPESQMARVLAIADYRMKCYAMYLDKSPVAQMPSYIELLKAANRTPKNAMPRFWMACNYQPLGRSQDGLAWELRGQGVKALTEDEFLAADGTVTGTGQSDPLAKRWADTMTEKYEELAAADPVFGDLRNVMDVCVAAAVIARENLMDRAGGDGFPLLTQANSDLKTEQWPAPRSAPTQCSYLKVGRSYVITASGGVQVESWQVAKENEVDPAVEQVRDKAAPAADTGWCWN